MSDLLADHYRALVEERGHEVPDFALGDIPASLVREVFACSDGGAEFASRLDAGARSLVTAGVSMTGPPHVGTLGQILTAIRLQRAGLDVQVVLADLAAYNAAGRELEEVRALADRYREFARSMGFDADAGILRTQEEARDVLHTQILLSRYFDPDAGREGGDGGDADASASASPTEFEGALAAAYEAAESNGAETSAFADRQTTLSLVADTLHPVAKAGYENVCFVGGADNHGLARLFDRVLRRSPYEGSVAGLYTRLIAGREGYPKMSKSIPDSALALDATPEAVREYVRRSEGGDPDADPTFRMMRVASEYGPEELSARREACARGGEAWAEFAREYADYLAEAAERWQRTG